MGQPQATIYFRAAGDGGGSSSAPSHGPYASDFGHVLLVVTHGDGTTTAFDYWGEDGRGVVNPNVDANRLAELPQRQSWNITPEQDHAMTARIEALRAHPPAYALPPGETSTCVSNVSDILRAGGLDVGDPWTPSGFMDDLRDALTPHVEPPQPEHTDAGLPGGIPETNPSPEDHETDPVDAGARPEAPAQVSWTNPDGTYGPPNPDAHPDQNYTPAHPDQNYTPAHPDQNYTPAHPDQSYTPAHPDQSQTQDHSTQSPEYDNYCPSH